MELRFANEMISYFYTQHILNSELRVRFSVGYIPISIQKLDCYRYRREIINSILETIQYNIKHDFSFRKETCILNQY